MGKHEIFVEAFAERFPSHEEYDRERDARYETVDDPGLRDDVMCFIAHPERAEIQLRHNLRS